MTRRFPKLGQLGYLSFLHLPILSDSAPRSRAFFLYVLAGRVSIRLFDNQRVPGASTPSAAQRAGNSFISATLRISRLFARLCAESCCKSFVFKISGGGTHDLRLSDAVLHQLEEFRANKVVVGPLSPERLRPFAARWCC